MDKEEPEPEEPKQSKTTTMIAVRMSPIASKSLKRRREEQESLLTRNTLLEMENSQLQFKIKHLDDELQLLKLLVSEGSHVSEWAERMLNESLKQQVAKYRMFRKQCSDVFQLTTRNVQRKELLHVAKVNAFFMLEKISYLMDLNRKQIPLAAIDQQLRKKDALYKEMLRVCLREYGVQTGVVDADLSSDDLLEWRHDLDLSSSKAQVRIHQKEDIEKWVSFDVFDYPVSKEIMKKVLEKIDIFSVIMMGSTATKAHVDENGGSLTKGWGHSVGYSKAVVPLSLFNEGENYVGNFKIEYKRPSQVFSEDLAFVSASDFVSNEKEYTLVQSLVPHSAAPLESLEENGAFFTRGVKISRGNPIAGKETCNISILLGLKQSWKTKTDDPEVLELLKQFKNAMGILGGEAFMKPGMHSYEKMINGFEAVLKASVFVYLKLNDEKYKHETKSVN